MSDNDCLLTFTLVTRSIDYAKTNVDVVAKDICLVASARHPSIHRTLTRHESVRKVFTGSYIGIPSLVKEVPWLSTIRSHVRPVVIVCHVLGFGLRRVVELAVQYKSSKPICGSSSICATEQGGTAHLCGIRKYFWSRTAKNYTVAGVKSHHKHGGKKQAKKSEALQMKTMLHVGFCFCHQLTFTISGSYSKSIESDPCRDAHVKGFFLAQHRDLNYIVTELQ